MHTSATSSTEKIFSDEYSLISTTTTDSRITYANDHFCDVAGYQQHELEGQYHNIVRHPDMPKAAFKDMWDHLKKNKSWMGLVKNRCKNGGHYWVNAYVTPIVDERGNVYEYQSVRTKPGREQIARAQRYYQQLQHNHLPLALRLPRLSVTSVSIAISGLGFLLLLAQMSLQGASLWTGITAGLLAVQGGLGVWLGQKLKTIAGLAKLEMESEITTVLYTGRRDELATIEFALRMKQAELRAVVGRTGDTCDTILHTAENDAAVIKTITENVDRQFAETEQLAAAIHEMSASIRDVAAGASGTSAQASEVCMTAEEGKASMEATVRVVNSLHEELDRSKGIIEQLDADAHQINGILDVITSIADQTNLLALNAAIEAARVGEQGRGFAVVADEIRQLAMKSRTSSDEIHKMISKLQGSAEAAVSAVEQGAELSDECRQRANAAGRIFEQINQKLNLVTDASHQIATAVEQQVSVTESINQGVHSIRTLSEQSKESSYEAVDRIDQLVNKLQGVVRLIRQFRC